MKSKSFSRLIQRDKVFYTLNSIFLLILFIIVAYPLIFIISCSFSSPAAITSGKVKILPVDFSTIGYNTILENKGILLGYINTIFYTSCGTVFSVVLTIMAAYPLSRKDMYGRNPIMFVFAFTMLFSGGLIPSYLLVYQLGMLNTRWAMIIPGALSIYNVIITRTFYQTTIPDELLECSKLDGCSDFKFMWHIVIPLSGAITAVNILFYAVGRWNSYFDALIYLTNAKLYPLQIILRDILVLNTIDYQMNDIRAVLARIGMKDLLKYSLIVVSSVPVICLYPFVQKYFIKGVMLGAIKG